MRSTGNGFTRGTELAEGRGSGGTADPELYRLRLNGDVPDLEGSFHAFFFSEHLLQTALYFGQSAFQFPAILGGLLLRKSGRGKRQEMGLFRRERTGPVLHESETAVRLDEQIREPAGQQRAGAERKQRRCAITRNNRRTPAAICHERFHKKMQTSDRPGGDGS